MMSELNPDIFWQRGFVRAEDRVRLLGQTPMTIWLTGLSGSGKSTIAFSLERQLVDMGRAAFVLDGDNIRHGLNNNLGFSPEDRTENIRRVAQVARLMNQAGLIVITAFISPYAQDRELARDIVGEEFFREVHVCTPMAVCEKRDPKGLYGKARSGLITNFTGISAPYEPPQNAHVQIDTSILDLEEATRRLLTLLTLTDESPI